MGKYAEALGKWELKIEDDGKTVVEWTLKPRMGDKRKFLKMVREFQNDKGEMIPSKGVEMLEAFEGFVRDVIARDYPPVNGEEDEELKALIEMYNNTLLNEFMLLFKLTTREQLRKVEEDPLGGKE